MRSVADNDECWGLEMQKSQICIYAMRVNQAY